MRVCRDDAVRAIHKALDVGVTFIDTAADTPTVRRRSAWPSRAGATGWS